MADWLALHGLTAADCLGLLFQPQAVTAAPRRAPDPEFDCPELWPMMIDALDRALPPASEVLALIRTDVRIDLAPDPQRFPRAFTLHDDGRGLPFISCPMKGRTSDLLILAHELGHACQIVASGRSDFPPVLRETAAYLAEGLVLAAIRGATPDTGAILEALHRARGERVLHRDGRALALALADPATPYSYGWNYPIARILAERAARHLTPEARWEVYTGAVGISQLWALPAA